MDIHSDKICVSNFLLSKNITSPRVNSQLNVLLSTDHALFSHVISVCTGDYLVCGLQCLRNDKCRSYNCFAAENQSTEICHLNNETQTSRPGDFKGDQGTTYFGLMQVYMILICCLTEKKEQNSIVKTLSLFIVSS